MTSFVLHPQQECAPHVIRTLAMAFAIALNLTALLIALQPLPSRPFAPPAASNDMQATVLPRIERLPPPPLPVLTPLRHVTHAAATHATSKPITAAPGTVTNATTAERATLAAPVTQTAGPVSPPAASDATIAYETATPPPYPIAALRAGEQGTVLLRVLVDETGKPVQILVAKSSGSRELDQAALKHVLAAWRFHPAQRDGHAVPAWAQVPVEFKLSGA